MRRRHRPRPPAAAPPVRDLGPAPRLHAAARAGRLTAGTRNHAAEQFTYATRFLSWLTARHQNLAGITQADTAANPAARWQFPGGRPGQPLTPGALLPSLRRLGIPATQARTSALRELVLQAPAPVIAQALGYSHTNTHKHLADAAGTRNKYPPAPHNQRRQHPPSAPPGPTGTRP
jgi:hypothetical protein